MRRLAVLTLIAVAGCTPAQEAAWMRWFHRDPEPAVEWVINECGDLCEPRLGPGRHRRTRTSRLKWRRRRHALRRLRRLG